MQTGYDPVDFGFPDDFVFGVDPYQDEELLRRIYRDGPEQGQRAYTALGEYYGRVADLEKELEEDASAAGAPTAEDDPAGDPLRGVDAKDRPAFEALGQTLPILIGLQSIAQQAREAGDDNAAEAAEALVAQMKTVRAGELGDWLGWLGETGKGLKAKLDRLQALEDERRNAIVFGDKDFRNPETTRRIARIDAEIASLETAIPAETEAALYVAESLGSLAGYDGEIPPEAAPFFAASLRSEAPEKALATAKHAAVDAMGYLAASETAKTLPERIENAAMAAMFFARSAELHRRSGMSEGAVAMERFGQPALEALDLALTLFPEAKIVGPAVKGARRLLSPGGRAAAAAAALALLATPEDARANLLQYTARQLVDRPFKELVGHKIRWLVAQNGKLHHPLSFGIFRDSILKDMKDETLTMSAESMAAIARALRLNPQTASLNRPGLFGDHFL